MTITANGKKRTIADAVDLATFLRELGLEPQRVVVEHNGTAVHRDRFASITLQAGDRLEIAHMVGGG
jgi:thiamine biosynthesis protein ThiS